MLTIENGNITLTRGDTMTLTVGMTKDGEPYVMQEGDSLRFALSIGHKGDAGYKLITAQNIPSDTKTFTVSSEVTETLTRKVYCYDVELNYANGEVDTFISGNLYIVGESE